MDLTEYKKEVERLEREVSSLDSSSVDTASTAVSTSKFSAIMKYKIYIVVFVCVFLFLLIFQPKFVLKIETQNNHSRIVVDKKKFFIWWIGAGVFVSFVCSIVGKFKKRS